MIVARSLLKFLFMNVMNVVGGYVGNENIDFKFSPSYASWYFGHVGLYECFVQNFKRAAVHTIGRKKI